MQQRKIAVSHAGGVVAEAVLERLQQQQVDAQQLVLLDSEAQLGSRIAYGDTYLVTKNQENFDYSDCGLLLLLAEDQAIEELARSQGCFILGCVKADNAPLAYGGAALDEPEIGYGADSVRLPGPEACCLLDVLVRMSQMQDIEHINLTVLQSASQQGKPGIDELASQTINLLNTREIKPSVFPWQIAFNLLATASDPEITNELGQFLDISPTAITVNTVITPVFYGLAAAVSVRFSSDFDLQALTGALKQLDGVQIGKQGGSIVSDCNQSFSCVVSEIHRSGLDSQILSFWLMADAHRYGLARNYASLSAFLQNSYL